MNISVIMASYLEDYSGAAKYRVDKFKRAVSSFVAQQCPDTELIVVADGCKKTHDAFYQAYEHEGGQRLKQIGGAMRLVTLEKQGHFSGAVRNAGIDAAAGEIISYLDTDDMFMPGHLLAITAGFTVNPNDLSSYRRWVYYNDFIAAPNGSIARERHTHLTFGGIGTSSIAHEKSLGVRWQDGYGHDWRFVQDLQAACPHTKKIPGGQYLVCHIPGIVDF